jgi:hypothetical protein
MFIQPDLAQPSVMARELDAQVAVALVRSQQDAEK